MKLHLVHFNLNVSPLSNMVCLDTENEKDTSVLWSSGSGSRLRMLRNRVHWIFKTVLDQEKKNVDSNPNPSLLRFMINYPEGPSLTDTDL